MLLRALATRAGGHPLVSELHRALATRAGGYPLVSELHDGVCFVLRRLRQTPAPFVFDGAQLGMLTTATTGAANVERDDGSGRELLSLTLANHAALPAALDAATYGDLREAYAQKLGVAEDPVMDWPSAGPRTFWEVVEEALGRRMVERRANVVFFLDAAAGRLVRMELPLGGGADAAGRPLTYAPRGAASRSAAAGEEVVTLQTLPNTSRQFGGMVATRAVPASRVVGGWPTCGLVSAERALRLLRPQIRSMWPEPVEAIRFVRTLRATGEEFEADDEAALIDVAPDSEEDLAIVVNGTRCAVVFDDDTETLPMTPKPGVAGETLELVDQLVTDHWRVRARDWKNARVTGGAHPKHRLASSLSQAAIVLDKAAVPGRRV